jgi:hypothetical protein
MTCPSSSSSNLKTRLDRLIESDRIDERDSVRPLLPQSTLLSALQGKLHRCCPGPLNMLRLSVRNWLVAKALKVV